MNEITREDGNEHEPRLTAEFERARRRPNGVEVVVRLTNADDQRTLHYVSEVRAVLPPDADGKVLVRLTDEGREIIPGGVDRLPTFARIDPGGTALLTILLPATIVRMRTPLTPTTEVELEEHDLGQAEMDLVIGWSDTPFYSDPREERTESRSTKDWERGTVRVTVPRRRAR